MKRGITVCCVLLVAAVCAVSANKSTKMMKCMQDSGVTPDQVKKLMSPNHEPSAECLCFVGCMAHGENIWEKAEEIKEGSKEAEAKECIDKITATTDCEVGREMYSCAKSAGVIPI